MLDETRRKCYVEKEFRGGVIRSSGGRRYGKLRSVFSYSGSSDRVLMVNIF